MPAPLMHALRWLPTLYVLAALAWPFLSTRHRLPPAIHGGSVEFQPHPLLGWLWMPLTAGAGALFWAAFAGPGIGYVDLCAALGYAAVTGFHLFEQPGTISVSGEGLEQHYWLRADKRIPWRTIDAIEMGRPSSPIVLIGQDGTRIVYWNTLTGRAELIGQIRQYCQGELPPEFPEG